jgi:lysozyme
MENKAINIVLPLVKKHEGIKLSAYYCAAQKPTIGFGNTFYLDGKAVKIGDKITQQQADELLMATLLKFQQQINEAVKVNLTPNQEAALISFVYNIGIGAFRQSTLLKLLNRGEVLTAADQFDRWTRAGGKILKGLVTRRKEEKALFLS